MLISYGYYYRIQLSSMEYRVFERRRMISTDDFAKAVELIGKSNNILITSHIRPDGDGCGSIRALCDTLTALGKKTQPLLLSPLADWYGFLFEPQAPILGNDITIEQLSDKHFDMVIIADTNSYVQLPELDEWLKASNLPKLVIDHHITGDGLGIVELIDTTAAATGQIVSDLLRYADWPITEAIAEALFVAIATDTGWFRFQNADGRVFRNTAELIDLGVNPSEIYHKLYQNYSPARFKLLGKMLESLELQLDGKIAFQHLMRADFDETGAVGRDTEDFVNECQRIQSVEAAALFVELKDGDFRCSLRSKGEIDVRAIAQKFGGGGHKVASGVNLPGPLEKAKKLILSEMKLQFTAAHLS